MVFAVGLMLGLGLAVGRTVKADRDIEPQATGAQTLRWQDARLLAEVLRHVREDYVESISDEELINAAIRGLFADLDPHSAYLDRTQFNDMRISTTGAYSGVGIEVETDDETVRVVTPIAGGPAARAGILAGDTLLAIDGIEVDPLKLQDTIDRMRGKAGTTVNVTFVRPPETAPTELTLTRASVQLSSVKSRLLEPNVGYVRISHFSKTTTEDVERALGALKKENGRKLSGLVLDLRNNPGGLLDAAVGVSDVFLNDGVIVSAEGRARDARFAMEAQQGDVLEGAPLVVLVNGKSASASEIVAGALQDHKRATLVGQQTFGKGSVQTVVPLSDGHAIKLTTSRYFTPSGRSIQKTGITPDVVVDPKDIERAGDAKVDANAALGDLHGDYELRLALETVKATKGDDAIVAIRQSRAP